MYKELTFCDFCNEFSEQYKDNFSYEGKKALFDYLEEYEESTGEKLECDIIAFCCEYTEYEDLKELQKNYNIETIEELENHTTVIPIYDYKGEKKENFIIQDF